MSTFVLRLWLVLLLSYVSLQGRSPNVIFIMADDLGYGDFSCYGATKVKTPYCDRVAREGMMFTDAHSPSAVCTPTRYSVLTGRYCWRTWLKNWVLMYNHPLLVEQDRLTMGKMFQENGYYTGCIGKWHLGWGNEPNIAFNGEVKPGPLEVGFDTFFGVPFSHNSPKPQQVYMRDRRIIGLNHGEDYRDKEVMKRTVRSLEDTATDISKQAVSFIEENKDRPFFLYYPTTNIHFPITPHERFKGATEAGVYGDFVAEFDWAVGEVLNTLDRLDLTQNTILIVTSDNGARPMSGMNGHECNGPWRGTKRTIYEAGHRVPLVVRWPGKVRPGSTSDETVTLLDFMRTFATMLGHKLPCDAGEDSYDITSVLLRKPHDQPLREATVHHSVNGTFAIRQGNWKLIEGAGDGDYELPNKVWRKNIIQPGFPERDPTTGGFLPLMYNLQKDPQNKADAYQLYNLKEDPKEAKDVAADHPEVVARMKDLLNQYRDTGRSVK